MRWCCDANVPAAAIRRLRAAGWDVISSCELDPAMPDHAVLALARQQACTLVTYDRDFGDLLFRQRHPPPAGVMFFRYQPPLPAEPAERLIAIVGADPAAWSGRYVTIDADRLRFRPMPPIA